MNITSVQSSRGHRLERQAPPCQKCKYLISSLVTQSGIAVFFQYVQHVNALQSQTVAKQETVKVVKNGAETVHLRASHETNKVLCNPRQGYII